MTVIQSIENHVSKFEFSEDDFLRIAKFAKLHFGLHLPNAKKQLVYGRLSRRLRYLKLTTFGEYMNLVEAAGNDAERLELLSALTTNVTHFFRENHHFEQLFHEVLPKLENKGLRGRGIRIWSAGCSTGPEPYSIAATLLKYDSTLAEVNAKILATDIDPGVLVTAKNGKYDLGSISSLPESQKRQILALSSKDSEYFCLNDYVKSFITFRELNLKHNLPFSGKFDIVFCRNVAIYFDRDMQKSVWSKIASVLNPGGYLFIGHSERLSGEIEREFHSIGVTAYQKTTNNFGGKM